MTHGCREQQREAKDNRGQEVKYEMPACYTSCFWTIMRGRFVFSSSEPVNVKRC